MPFNAASVDAVNDATSEMQVLRALVVRPILVVENTEQGALTDSERDAVRTRMQARIQVLRQLCVNQVATW